LKWVLKDCQDFRSRDGGRRKEGMVTEVRSKRVLTAESPDSREPSRWSSVWTPSFSLLERSLQVLLCKRPGILS
jgi:hypothetical protein